MPTLSITDKNGMLTNSSVCIIHCGTNRVHVVLYVTENISLEREFLWQIQCENVLIWDISISQGFCSLILWQCSLHCTWQASTREQDLWERSKYLKYHAHSIRCRNSLTIFLRSWWIFIKLLKNIPAQISSNPPKHQIC